MPIFCGGTLCSPWPHSTPFWSRNLPEDEKCLKRQTGLVAAMRNSEDHSQEWNDHPRLLMINPIFKAKLITEGERGLLSPQMLPQGLERWQVRLQYSISFKLTQSKELKWFQIMCNWWWITVSLQSDQIVEVDFLFCHKVYKFRAVGSCEAKVLCAGIHWWFVSVYRLVQYTATQLNIHILK